MSHNASNNEARPNFPLVKSPLNPTAIKLSQNVHINKHIAQYLKDYQIEGVKFLYKSYANNRGCILADDMGLGKTIQIIAFLAAVLNKTGFKDDLNNTNLECIRKQLNLNEAKTEQLQFLIVCPASIIDNWIKEFNTWGYFSICKFHGTETERAETLKRFENSRCEIVITTHETCSRHIYRLKSLKFAAVIVDEFHKMKNDKSDVAKHLREFETIVRIGLSGTILQNDPIELWSLVDWVNPDSFGSKAEFNQMISKPIKEGHRQNATKLDLNKYTKSIHLLETLNKNVILRRTKELIADQLPKKTDQIVYCRLTDFQMEIYQKMIDSAEFQYLNTKCDECPCKKFNLKKKDCCFQELKMKEKTMQLAFINIFLKIANHPALLLSETANACNDYINKNLPELFHSKAELNDSNNCGKMKVLIQLLEAVYAKKAKVLLFSYSVKLLDIIQAIVSKKRYNFLRLDGSTKNKNRQSLVDQFNNNENCFLFLISTKAGGVGLNITSANVVIIFDPNWNPTHDLQAQDRAYRLGQLRDVHVYRLISSGCLEENIYLRQIYKMHLNKECVENESTKRFFQLSKDTKRGELFGLKNLFNLNSNRDDCYTLEILKRYTKIEKGIAGIEVSTFISPDEENENNGEESDQDVESFEDQINKVLRKNDVVHVHSNKDLLKESKIENYLRSAIKNDVISNNFANANDYNIRPDLSTLDCIELDQDDYEFNNSIKGTSQNRFALKSGNIIQYGDVPEEIKKSQFEKMAQILRISTRQLSEMVLKMNKETRFKKLKQFYLKTTPESKEFYEMFSSKRKSTCDDNEAKRVKLTNNEDCCFENIETLNVVLELIQEDEMDMNMDIYTNVDEDELLFQNFMNHKESLITKLTSSQFKESSNSKKDPCDKYDKILNDLFS